MIFINIIMAIAFCSLSIAIYLVQPEQINNNACALYYVVGGIIFLINAIKEMK